MDFKSAMIYGIVGYLFELVEGCQSQLSRSESALTSPEMVFPPDCNAPSTFDMGLWRRPMSSPRSSSLLLISVSADS